MSVYSLVFKEHVVEHGFVELPHLLMEFSCSADVIFDAFGCFMAAFQGGQHTMDVHSLLISCDICLFFPGERWRL